MELDTSQAFNRTAGCPSPPAVRCPELFFPEQNRAKMNHLLLVVQKSGLLCGKCATRRKNRWTRILVLLNKGTRWESGTRRTWSEVLYARSNYLFCESRSLGAILRRRGKGVEETLNVRVRRPTNCIANAPLHKGRPYAA